MLYRFSSPLRRAGYSVLIHWIRKQFRLHEATMSCSKRMYFHRSFRRYDA